MIRGERKNKNSGNETASWIHKVLAHMASKVRQLLLPRQSDACRIGKVENLEDGENIFNTSPCVTHDPQTTKIHRNSFVPFQACIMLVELAEWKNLEYEKNIQ